MSESESFCFESVNVRVNFTVADSQINLPSASAFLTMLGPKEMTAEKARKLCLILRQMREVVKDAIDNLGIIAENGVMIFADDETDRKTSTPSVAIENRLLNKTQLAERLSVSVRTINELQNEGLPTVNLRKRVLFDYEDVLIWVKGKNIKNYRKNKLRVVR